MRRKMPLNNWLFKLVLGLSVCSLSMSTLANASSVYDDLVHPVEQVFVGNSPSCPQTHDLTTSWYSILFDDAIPYAAPDSSYRTTVREAVNRALDNDTGLVVSQTQDGDTGYVGILATAYGFTSSINFTTLSTGYQAMMMSNAVGAQISWSYFGNGVCNFYISFAGKGTREVAFNMYSGVYTRQPMYINNPITYPTNYEGNLVPTFNQSADVDSDSLSAEQELRQNTSDLKADTDGDGLDDYIESQWNSNRDDMFCGVQCAYPDPTTKDVYVEIDWMKDTSNNLLYKPSATQLSLVEDMFNNKGINFHADTGQFGGGNELSTYTQTLSRTVTSGQVDFWDYRNGGDGITANFSSDRNLIWRYMIYGYTYAESTGSSGWAETMGDDLFISGGLIENMSGLVSLDRAIAGTMAHEVGHNLCLSDEQVFEEQPSQCVFSGIDNDIYKPQNYESVMNYRYQLTDDDDMGVVDYSDGSNSTDDHNDWDAVMLGMNGFSGTRTALGKIIGDTYISPKGNVYPVSPDGSVIIEEAPISEILESNKREREEEQMQQTAGDLLSASSAQSINVNDTAKLIKESEDESFDWTMFLGGGAILAVIAFGSTWYHLARRQ